MRPIPPAVLFAALVMRAAPAALAHPHTDDTGALRFTFIPCGWPDEVKITRLAP